MCPLIVGNISYLTLTQRCSLVMIAIDTNILARFYCDDPSDPEALKQRPIAMTLMTDSQAIFVAKTVVLELEWVMRGFYGFGREETVQVINHLLGLPKVTVENWVAVKDAVDLHEQGLDFADALHWTSGKHCDEFHTFDDRKFARRAARLALTPAVTAAK